MESKTNKRSSLFIKMGVLGGILVIGTLGAAGGSPQAQGDDNAAWSAATVNISETLATTDEAEFPAPVTVTTILTLPVTNTLTAFVPVIVEKTIIKTSGYAPIFERQAPEIPHIYRQNLLHSGDALYDDGDVICWLCHGVSPAEHEFWIRDAEVCERCHKVAATPTVTARG